MASMLGLWPKLPDYWAYRFFPLLPEERIGVQLNLTLWGEEATINRGRVDDDWSHWRPSRGEASPARLNVYLQPEQIGNHAVVFSYGEMLRRILHQDVAFQWTIIRGSPDVKVAAMRESEGFVKWGFGREHPNNPAFKPHILLAGPVIDYRPDNQPRDREWDGFEPIWLKIAENDETHSVYLLRPSWSAQGQRAIISLETPETIPEEVRLADV